MDPTWALSVGVGALEVAGADEAAPDVVGVLVGVSVTVADGDADEDDTGGAVVWLLVAVGVGVVLAGCWLTLPPVIVVPDPPLSVTVAAIGLPDSNSKPVTRPSASTNRANADIAMCFRFNSDHHRRVAAAGRGSTGPPVSTPFRHAAGLDRRPSALGRGYSDSLNRCATADSTAAIWSRSRVRSSECLYTAPPTTEITAPSAAPITVPATPKNEAATVALMAASTLATSWVNDGRSAGCLVSDLGSGLTRYRFVAAGIGLYNGHGPGAVPSRAEV